ncbi:dihydropyrimidinase [Petrotoga sp. 8T1HF07.NaAc.6.1]|uniref:dihydropyrimidinase n=1 Tax=Petrotoga sp. 8T1HF07.NaAc.6.1 TaxID=1351838 RepID=UPI00192C968D|nr:dihydropyrimidinase [Petrotoga sp. 8T1HF07.NaAc.6.1]
MLIKNGIVVTATKTEKKDIRILDEKIKQIESNLTPFMDEEVIDASGKYVFPGIIDSHTHFSLHARGTTSIDDFYWGGRSAALGGVTTHIDFADMEATSLMKGLENRLEETRDSVIDFHFHIVINNNFNPLKQNHQLREIRDFGISSLKAFTTYRDIYMLSPEKWEPLFKAASDNDLIVAVHAEDNEIIEKNIIKFQKENKLDVQYHPDIRSSEAEQKAVKEICEIAHKANASLYIVHLSSEKGYQVVKDYKKLEDFKLYVETTPHYLLLTRELLKGPKASFYFMTPPLRESQDNEALWEGIQKGLIDVIATDHCAYNAEQKSMGKNSLDIFPGIPGVETLLALTYTYGVNKGLISINRLVELLSTNPAKIFKLYPQKGTIAIDSDADLVIFDPNLKEVLNSSNTHSKAAYTPFEGFEVEGLPITTILRGKVIVKDRNFLGEKGFGRFIKAI